MKSFITSIVLLLALSAVAQEDNIFHERSFWRGNPNLNTVQEKIAEGHDPTAFNNNGFDATTLALLAGARPEVVGYLLSLEGNPVNKRTHDGRIYLHWATFGGKVENVRLLLEKGSEVDARDSRGNTPLTFGATNGLTHPEIYRLFEEKGVDLAREKNPQGANLLLLSSPFMEKMDMMDYFLNRGISLASLDDQGNGVFNYAARRGNIALLKELVNAGVDYQTLNKQGGNAFMFAAQGTRGFDNSLEVYQYLQDLGLKANIVAKDGSTPLHRIALSKVKPEILQFFIDAGANVDQQDEEGNTPFLNASFRNSLENVKILAQRSGNLNAVNHSGQSALMLAMENNSPEVVEFLLETGAKVENRDNVGNSVAYYWIVSFNPGKTEEFEQKLQLLQKNGVQMNGLQTEDYTLYHLAALTDNMELIKRLEDFKIPVNAKNEDGMTALHLAAMKAKNDDVMKYLITLGADKKATTPFGETAYELAKENEVLQKKKTSLEFLR